MNDKPINGSKSNTAQVRLRTALTREAPHLHNALERAHGGEIGYLVICAPTGVNPSFEFMTNLPTPATILALRTVLQGFVDQHNKEKAGENANPQG